MRTQLRKGENQALHKMLGLFYLVCVCFQNLSKMKHKKIP